MIMPTCLCGCGYSVTKPVNRYIFGHYAKVIKGIPKSPVTRQRLSLSHIGKGHPSSAETNEKISSKAKARWATPEFREKMLGIVQSDTYRKRQSESGTGRKNPHSTSTRANMKISQTIRYERQDERDKNRDISKKLWKTPTYIQHQMKSRGIKPNKLEIRFLKMLEGWFPGIWRFVGDSRDTDFIIDGKIPDYGTIILDNMYVIELFGSYWHQGENPDDRIKIFTDNDVKCIVIWDFELQSPEKVYDRVVEFMKC